MIKPINVLVLLLIVVGLTACGDENLGNSIANNVKEATNEIIKDDFPVSDIEVEKMPRNQLRKYRQLIHEYQKKYANDSTKYQRAQEMLNRINAIGANEKAKAVEVQPVS